MVELVDAMMMCPWFTILSRSGGYEGGRSGISIITPPIPRDGHSLSAQPEKRDMWFGKPHGQVRHLYDVSCDRWSWLKKEKRKQLHVKIELVADAVLSLFHSWICTY
jgi:hypothetical protein